MHLLGIGSHFVKLVKALLVPATSVVQVNGSITKEIALSHGVRQGCPISPLLFVISTQPLMDMLDEELCSGQLEGIQISHRMCIAYKLFADDLGMFIPASLSAFNAVKRILGCYESGSGAKLNLLKSIIIPFALDNILTWLIESGCIISNPGEVQKYLGAPIGINLSTDQLHCFFLNKTIAHLSSWSSRMLSFTGRTILIKYVLQAIPIYNIYDVSKIL